MIDIIVTSVSQCSKDVKTSFLSSSVGIESIPTEELRNEVLTALEPCDTDVTIISIIKNYLSEVI